MIRDITIHAVLNGFTVQVGCQTVVFNGLDELIGELRSYLGASDPNEIEESWLRNSLNSRKLDAVPQFDVVPPVAEYGSIPVRQYTYPARPTSQETARDFAHFEAREARRALDNAVFQVGGLSQDEYVRLMEQLDTMRRRVAADEET